MELSGSLRLTSMKSTLEGGSKGHQLVLPSLYYLFTHSTPSYQFSVVNLGPFTEPIVHQLPQDGMNIVTAVFVWVY